MTGNRIQLRHDDDSGSLPMLMLVIIATLAMGGVLLSMVIGQNRSSTFVQSRVSALQAAQSGVDYTIGQLRAATSDTDASVGLAKKLPCTTPSSPLTGTPGGTTNFAATVTYFDADPDTLGTTNLGTSSASGGQQLVCIPGYGTFFAGSGKYRGTVTPQYARITSLGCPGQVASSFVACTAGSNAVTRGRTLVVNYLFRLSNANYAGGSINVGNTTYCLYAETTLASPYYQPQAKTCDSTVPDQQKWAFDSNFRIVLASTQQAGQPLCLTAEFQSQPGGGVAHTDGQPLLMEPCANPVPRSQQWSYEGLPYVNFLATKTDGSQDLLCPGLDNQTPARFILTHCRTSGSDTDGNYLYLAASVGSGGANPQCFTTSTVPITTTCSAPTNQDSTGNGTTYGSTYQNCVSPYTARCTSYVVNFGQFGRCLGIAATDDPTHDPPVVRGKSMITFGCRARPDPAHDSEPIRQQWTIPAQGGSAGIIVSMNNLINSTDKKCATSPGVAGQIVTIASCNGSLSQSWLSCAGTSDGPSSYWIMENKDIDGDGVGDAACSSGSASQFLCMQADETAGSAATPTNAVIVRPCNSGTPERKLAQKWNAPPGISDSQLTNYSETGTPAATSSP